jgi:hypothetical protein
MLALPITGLRAGAAREPRPLQGSDPAKADLLPCGAGIEDAGQRSSGYESQPAIAWERDIPSDGSSATFEPIIFCQLENGLAGERSRA